MKESPIIEGIDELLALYREIDEAIKSFINSTTVNCPALCGRCCDTAASNVETSIFEVMPLALDIWETGNADSVLKGLENLHDNDPCFFYAANVSADTGGHCTVYSLRPLVCRLFGFYSMTGKYGDRLRATCPRLVNMKDGAPAGSIDAALLPSMTDYAGRSSTLNPFLGSKRYPFNSALRMALAMVGLKRDYLYGSHDLRKDVS
ncbi:MAG TPA: YkgJ family cysteine cluster protein [Spirochaetota bacterium]|nr:YkgJ family cysteine cluster protein [Spirochaetota bacterium]HPI88416.1 YkgJ family cysteine cluster protein [Spirochaetota bacterium]HPR49885.1 YkgJ family cysteine cluster protein [Spirochaetota bacterium]